MLGGLRALINHASRALSLIVATRRPLDQICRDLRFMGSPFYNNFVYVHLRPFNRNEADGLLQQMLKDTGVVFSPAERMLVDELAGTHPLLLQAAAGCVFDEHERTAQSGTVDRGLVLERFMDLTEHQWQDLWRWSTTGEQEMLMELARHAHAGAARLQARPEERKSLTERGLVVTEGGTYRLFSPTLRHWLMERTADQGRSNARAAGRTVRDRGGSMVFVSYSHKDEAEKDALLSHLGVLDTGAEMIEVWSDDEIGSGEAWEAAIAKAISRARVAVLLVTANFLTSHFILRKEVPALLKRRRIDGVVVIPVIAKECAWKRIEWLAKMNVRPKNGRPVFDRNRDPDAALSAIAEEVATIVSDS
jgi:hypothetical protein